MIQILGLRPMGPGALLIEVSGPYEARKLADWVHAQTAERMLEEVIPAAKTVLLAGEPECISWYRRNVQHANVGELEQIQGSLIEIPIRYDGADLSDVATRTGLTPREVAQTHSGAEYRVEFFGFLPGLAFLSGIPPILHLPRRGTPRVRVPAQSLAIANEFSLIYPRSSPGGWHLLGTNLGPPLWEEAACPPNRLRHGDRIVFRPHS